MQCEKEKQLGRSISLCGLSIPADQKPEIERISVPAQSFRIKRNRAWYLFLTWGGQNNAWQGGGMYGVIRIETFGIAQFISQRHGPTLESIFW